MKAHTTLLKSFFSASNKTNPFCLIVQGPLKQRRNYLRGINQQKKKRIQHFFFQIAKRKVSKVKSVATGCRQCNGRKV